MNENSNVKTSNIYDKYFSDISQEAKTNLSEMSVEKLKEMLNNKDMYSEKMLEYIQYLIDTKEKSQYGNININENSISYKQINTKNVKILGGIIAGVIILIVCLAIFIINYNIKEQERLSAIERIDVICDELYKIESIDTTDIYYRSQDKLKEVKELLDKHKIKDLRLDKYNDVSSYIEDLKIYDEMMDNLYASTKVEVSNFHNNVSKLKNEKITSKINDHLSTLSEQAKKIILMNSFYAAQQYTTKSEPGAQINSTIYYTGESQAWYLSSESSVTNYYVDFVISNSSNFGDIKYGSRDIYNNTLEEINDNGKKGIIVTYTKDDRQGWSMYWYVGYDVEAYYDTGRVMYKVTKYSKGKSETQNMTIDELLNFGLTPA